MAAVGSGSCTSLKEICDFEWSKVLLDPSKSNQQHQATDSETKKSVLNSAMVRKFENKSLDLHGLGLGEKKAAIVLAGLLPRVAEHLTSLNIRCHTSVCSALSTLSIAPLVQYSAQI